MQNAAHPARLINEEQINDSGYSEDHESGSDEVINVVYGSDSESEEDENTLTFVPSLMIVTQHRELQGNGDFFLITFDQNHQMRRTMKVIKRE